MTFINIYTFYKVRFFEVNKVIEQIYTIIFLKRLNFYGQIKSMELNLNKRDSKKKEQALYSKVIVPFPFILRYIKFI